MKEKLEKNKINIELILNDIHNLYVAVHMLAVKSRKIDTELSVFTREEDKNYEEINENLKVMKAFSRL